MNCLKKIFLQRVIRNCRTNWEEGVIVKHRKFGKGVVTEIEGEHIRIRFGDDEKKMDLKVLARLGLLEI